MKSAAKGRQRSWWFKLWQRRPEWEFNTGTLLIIATIVLALTTLAIWKGPDLLADEPQGIGLLDENRRVAAQNAFEQTKNQVRTTLVQAIGGALILLTVAASLGQLRTAREGQVIDRFTKTVDQLGDEQTDVRLGGIYGLKQIADQRRQYAQPIAEILAAYLKTHGVPPAAPTTPPLEDPANPWYPFIRGTAQDAERLHPDLQAILRILIADRLWVNSTDGPLDLSYVHAPYVLLPGADLSSASLIRATLRGSNLEEAHLTDSDSRYADFSRARLKKADFQRARLNGSDFRSADLSQASFADATIRDCTFSSARLVKADLKGIVADRANFSGEGTTMSKAAFDGAHLTDATFAGSDLSGANFAGATLVRADFSFADLSGATLVNTNLTGARFDDATIDERTSFEHTSLDDAQREVIRLLRDRSRAQRQASPAASSELGGAGDSSN